MVHISPPHAQASSGHVLKLSAQDGYSDDSADDVKLARKTWMKEDVIGSESLSCEDIFGSFS
jgi:hypothetical protein